MSVNLLTMPSPSALDSIADLDSCVADFTLALASIASAKIEADNARADGSTASIRACVAIAYAFQMGEPIHSKTYAAFAATGVKKGSLKVYWAIARRVLSSDAELPNWYTDGRTLADCLAEAIKSYGKFSKLRDMAFPGDATDAVTALVKAYNELFPDQQKDFLDSISA